MLAMLPAAVGLVDVDGALPGFLLVGGLVYALAGAHLARPLLWVGVLMLAAYVVLVLLAPPHLWPVAGVMIALALVWTGTASLRPPVAPAQRWTASTVSPRGPRNPSGWPASTSDVRCCGWGCGGWPRTSCWCCSPRPICGRWPAS